MKKIILVAVFALLGTGAFAQVSFNAKAGLNLSKWMGSDAGDAKIKAGFKVGVGMEYQFNDLISLQPSLMLATKGWQHKESYSVLGVSGNVKASVNQAYLELPIMVGFRFNIGGNTNIVLSAGPYLGVGIGGKSKIKLSGDITWADLGLTQDDATANTFGEDSNLKRFDAGLGVGAAVEFGSMSVGFDTEFGLVNLSENAKMKNMSVGIGVGYRF